VTPRSEIEAVLDEFHAAAAAADETRYFATLAPDAVFIGTAHYGACRGTGVLQRHGDVWKIEQYNLALPIPDEIAPEVVARVREMRPA